MHLLCSHFPPTQSLVAVVDEGIMYTIYTRSWNEAYYNSDDMAHQALHELLEIMWTQTWIVFPSITSGYFHGLLVNYVRSDTANGCLLRGYIHHIDSFLSTDAPHMTSILDFME